MKELKYMIVVGWLFISTSSFAQDIFISDRLEKLWETSVGLRTTESVLYDPSEKYIYISSINENPWEKDDNGYITRHKDNGNIINYEWVKEMSAPRGMGLLQGKLYVANIDEVVEIDTDKAEITHRYKHPKAKNLNDIAIGADGRVFISDSKGQYLFEIYNGVMDVLFQTEDGPINGLFYETGRLLCGQENRLAALDLTTKTMSSFIEDTGKIDGIKGVGDSTYLISDWEGRVHLLQQGKPKELLLDTTASEISAADIEYDPYERILYVPTFFSNSVVAYKFK